MRGHPTKTPERIAEATRLREQGWTWKEIAEHFGVGRTTAFAWVDDPDGSKKRSRIRSYGGRCDICGGPTDGSAGKGQAPQTCMDCITWTRDDCIAAVLAFFDEHGYPPRVTRRIDESGTPSEKTARRLFGGWNQMLLAAGLPLACDRRESTHEQIVERIKRGDRVADIAADLGCTTENVYLRLRRRGLTLTELRDAA